MNTMVRRCAMVAGIVLSGSAFAGYVSDNFDSDGNGTALSGVAQWASTDPSVMVTNAQAHSAPLSAIIPILQNLTNTVSLGIQSNIVWSDFWTIPRPFQSTTDTAPAVDTNATAQLFVSNGYWVAISGDGAGNLVTNAFTAPIPSYGSLQQVANDGSSWCHVSICHDYSNKVWSLFIGGTPVATNLGFINRGVSNYQWFAVQNGGGDPSNTTFLDDVLITNAAPTSLGVTNSHGLRAAWALTYYGSLDPSLNPSSGNGDGYTLAQDSILNSNPYISNSVSPIAYAFGTPSNITSISRQTSNLPPISIGINLGTTSVATNQLLFATVPTGPFSNIGSVSGTGQVTFVDNTGLARSAKGFYLASAVTPIGSITNTANMAAWTEPSYGQISNYYWVGIVIDYGSNDTLNSQLGADLTAGLHPGLNSALADTLTTYSPSQQTFYVSSLYYPPKWCNSQTLAPASNAIPLGQSVLIYRRGGSSWNGSTNAMLSQINWSPVALDPIPLVANWNLVAWPKPTLANDPTASVQAHFVSAGNTTNPAMASRIWLNRNGQLKQLRQWADGAWHFEPNTASMPSNTVWGYLQSGDTFFYTNASGSAQILTP